MSRFPTRISTRRMFLERGGAAMVAGGAAASATLFWMRMSEGNAQEPSDPKKDVAWDDDSWDGWMTVDGFRVPSDWERNAGTIHLRSSPERTGHIVTRREYGDFRLEFEWRIAPGGNSGIKYRVRRYDDRMLGCEYQIYDEGSARVDPKNQTGALYDLYEPVPGNAARPAGEWNQGVICLQADVVEHWLNGVRIVRAEIGDPDWDRRVAASKFNDVPDFGRNRMGRIMLTDHGSEVWYRNLVFREIPGTDALPSGADCP